MEKWYWIVGILVLILIVVLGVIYYNSGVRYAPGEGQNCKTLYYNGRGATNIVFFSDAENAKSYADLMLSTKPYADYKDEFNVFYIDNYSSGCELYQGIAVYCYSKNLIREAAQCPNDYIFVIKPEEGSIRSSSYMNVISINSNSIKNVLLHEFGHSFANLADEYVPAKISRGSKNCVSKCDDFGNMSDGCFMGCSNDNYYRPIDSGLMRNLGTLEYGIFNSEIIRNKIGRDGKGITGNAISDEINCGDKKYYLMEVRNENGELKVISKSLEVGCGDGVVNRGEFDSGLIFTDSESSGGTYDSNESLFVGVPYVEGEKSVDVEVGGLKVNADVGEMGGIPCKVE